MKITVFNRPYWRVYIEDFGQKCIEKYNIFDHNEFWDMCNIMWIDVHDHNPEISTQKTEFQYAIQNELAYFFENKHEWEVVLTTTIKDSNDFNCQHTKNLFADARPIKKKKEQALYSIFPSTVPVLSDHICSSFVLF